jgi:Uma2 family endonuclease
MAIQTPPLSVDDQDYYPLHGEDDVPETPPHEAAVRYARDVLAARFPDWFVTGNVCIYWEQGNTEKYRAPDVFVVKEPLSEPVTRVYQLWKQPPVAFVLEVGSRSTFRQDVGPKVEVYRDWVKAREYYHVDLDHRVQRLWRQGPGGYEERAPASTGRLRSAELGLEFELDEAGTLRIYTEAGELLLSHTEEQQRRIATEGRLEEAAERLEATEERLAAAEQQAAEEAARRAELERQLAALQARLAEREPGA